MVGVTIISAGTQTTVQDLAGRPGMWDVGVPPSGAADELSFALVNAAVGNPDSAAALECVLIGPVLTLRRGPPGLRRRRRDRARRSTGDRYAPEPWRGWPPARCSTSARSTVLECAATSRSKAGSTCHGCWAAGRPSSSAGSAASMAGRSSQVTFCAWVAGRIWSLRHPSSCPSCPTVGCYESSPVRTERRITSRLRGSTGSSRPPGWWITGPTGPAYGWSVPRRVGLGPTGARPGCTRRTCTTPPIRSAASCCPATPRSSSGRTGRRLGGFVVPAVVIEADRWMLGQLRPGDAVQLLPVTTVEAAEAIRHRRSWLADLRQDPVAAVSAGDLRRTGRRCSTRPRQRQPHRSTRSGARATGTCWWRRDRPSSI